MPLGNDMSEQKTSYQDLGTIILIDGNFDKYFGPPKSQKGGIDWGRDNRGRKRTELVSKAGLRKRGYGKMTSPETSGGQSVWTDPEKVQSHSVSHCPLS